VAYRTVYKELKFNATTLTIKIQLAVEGEVMLGNQTTGMT
jgi:hypothetical protein